MNAGRYLAWLPIAAMVVGCGGNSDNSGPNQFGSRYNRDDRSKQSKPVDPTNAKMEAMIGKLSAGNRDFALRLASQLSGTENLALAPYSVSLALQIAAAGAGSGMEQEMARALNVNSLDGADRLTAARELSLKLAAADPAVQLDIANSIWVQKGFKVLPSYLKEAAEKFQANTAELDFADPKASSYINAWVKSATKNKIERIVPDSIDPDVRMYLINAVYFKGAWTTPFDKQATLEDDFTRSDGKVIKTPFMRRSGMIKTYESDLLRGVWLPYGKERFGMALFVPKEGKSAKGIMESLTPNSWRSLEQSAMARQTMLVMPRFEIVSDLDLKGPLQSLGMKTPFVRDQADFSKIRAEKDLFVSAVKHKAVIKVDEEGSEAAGATSVEMSVTSIPQYFEVIANKPFVFFIVDQETDTILFAGLVEDPANGR